MTNERAIEILTDLRAWFNDSQPLYWSTTEISQAIAYAKVEIYPLFEAKVLQDYIDWLEFGKPFYHKIKNLETCIIIAIEILKSNQ